MTPLEDRVVPATVFYDDRVLLPLSNTLFLNPQMVFESPGYDPNVGPLQVVLDTTMTEGSVSLVNGYDFYYLPGPEAYGIDTFNWEVLQGGESLVGVQTVAVDLGDPLEVPSDPNPAPMRPEPTITFSTYQLNSANSDRALFLSSDVPLAEPVINLSVQVTGSPGGPAPTGTVLFTYSVSGGPSVNIGVGSVGPDGKSTVPVDSGMLDDPGVVVSASFSGDANFLQKSKSDAGKTATDLNANPPVTDNPVVPPNAQNLTVVVLGGNNAAEREKWRDSARAYYGAGAFLITDVQTIPDLGNRLAALPAGSISKLVFGAHGYDGSCWLGYKFGTAFNAFYLDRPENATAKQQIKAALAPAGASIEFQSCEAAKPGIGVQMMQDLANLLNVSVKGPVQNIKTWDDNRPTITWVTKNPQ